MVYVHLGRNHKLTLCYACRHLACDCDLPTAVRLPSVAQRTPIPKPPLPTIPPAIPQVVQALI